MGFSLSWLFLLTIYFCLWSWSKREFSFIRCPVWLFNSFTWGFAVVHWRHWVLWSLHNVLNSSRTMYDIFLRFLFFFILHANFCCINFVGWLASTFRPILFGQNIFTSTPFIYYLSLLVLYIIQVFCWLSFYGSAVGLILIIVWSSGHC